MTGSYLPAPTSVVGLVGRTVVSASVGKSVVFITDDGFKFEFHLPEGSSGSAHVALGNTDTLLNTPIQFAGTNSNHKDEDCGQQEFGSETWTVHNFDTLKGRVVIRWTDGASEFFNSAVFLTITKEGEKPVEKPAPVEEGKSEVVTPPMIDGEKDTKTGESKV